VGLGSETTAGRDGTGLPAARRLNLLRLLDVGDLAYRYAIVIAWVAVIVIFGGLRPDTFLTASNFQTIFGTQAVLLILTLGLLFPLAAGEFDLSIGGTIGFGAMLTVVLNVNHGVAIGWAIVAAVAFGLLVGLVNAFFVVRVGVHSFVVTLGTGTVLIGVTYAISDSQTVGGVAQGLVDAVRTRPLLGLPLVFYYALGLTIVVWYVLSHTPVGRYLLFVGLGRDIARLGGIRVDVFRTAALVASAVVAAVAGVMLAGSLGAADPNAGAAYLLPAFAGAFLGSTAVQPDRFNPWGAFVAVYFLVTGITGLQLLGYAGWVEQVFYGTSLVLAVTFSQLVSRSGRARAS
jgi:ribose transport system permease protein